MRAKLKTVKRRIIKLKAKGAIKDIDALKPEAKRYEVRTDQRGIIIVILPSGLKSYYAQWARGERKLLDHHPVMTPAAAYTQGLDVLRDPPRHGTRKTKTSTLRQFLDDDLEPWATAHRKWGAGSVKRIKSAFADRLDKPLADLNAWVIEKWRSQRLKAGIAEGTVNRELAGLKSALTKAVEWGALAAHPLAAVKLRKVDNARVRYLTSAEEKRLRAALVQRDRAGIAARRRGNDHRASRGYELLSVLPTAGYCDHLTPMVLSAVNTGLRRGELTTLDWSDINLTAKRLHVRAAAAKSGKSRHVPLNKESVAVLTRWQRQTGSVGRVFNVRDVKTAWLALMEAAKIEGFRLHDLRHTFASKLVMAGVDLNTVRELLGHADLKMTLRYSHLAHEHKQSAVEKLVARK